MILCAIKALGLWLLAGFLGTNILGLIVRGLLGQGVPSLPEDASSDVQQALRPVIRKALVSNVVMTGVAVIVACAYFMGLYRYCGGPLSVVAGGILMAGRLPDLLREIRTGQPPAKTTSPMDAILSLLFWAALPLFWFALC